MVMVWVEERTRRWKCCCVPPFWVGSQAFIRGMGVLLCVMHAAQGAPCKACETGRISSCLSNLGMCLLQAAPDVNVLGTTQSKKWHIAVKKMELMHIGASQSLFKSGSGVYS